jgi:hypothetical protein
MKSNTCFINGLIVGFLALFLGGIGLLVGNSAVGEYNPPWTHYPIPAPSKEIVDIAHVEIMSTLPDPTGDTIFVKAKDGEVYSNTLFQNEWSIVDPIPTWDTESLYDCTGEWLVPSDSHMWDAPPVDKGVVDSYGALFERPVSTIVRCYVLSDDGSLEVWVHSGNAMDLLAGVFMKIVYGTIGAIIGIVIGVIIIRFRRKAVSLAT